MYEMDQQRIEKFRQAAAARFVGYETQDLQLTLDISNYLGSLTNGEDLGVIFFEIDESILIHTRLGQLERWEELAP